jgi:hypothetical protein
MHFSNVGQIDVLEEGFGYMQYELQNGYSSLR